MDLLCSRNYINFIKTINSADNFSINTQEAVSYIADELKIAKIEVFFEISRQYKKINGNDYSNVLFESDFHDYNRNSKVVYKKFTPSVGDITYYAYCFDDAEEWSAEEKEIIDFILENIHTSASKAKLIENFNTVLSTDLDTGIYNPSALYKYIDRIIDKGEVTGFSAVFINVKNLKYYNENYGMSVGNNILFYIAKTLSNFCDDGEKICRLGGDNFALFIRTSRKQQWIEKLKSLYYDVNVNGKTKRCFIGVYAGMAEIPADAKTSNQALAPANNAYRVAKFMLKTDFLEYSEEISKMMNHRKEVAAEYKNAMASGDLKVYYQPKVDLKTYKLCGAEALSRWEYKGEIKSPFWYIPILEQTNAICELDIYNLEIVCKNIKEWIDQGITPVCISINFSRKHLANPELVENIISIIKKYNIPKEYIEIEITETTDTTEYTALINFITELRKNDIAVSIDDFGTGFSSLNILKDVPVDIIKLDKSFLDDTDYGDRMSIVVSDLVSMAKHLRIKTVSEGVETKNQAQFLENISCDIAQGYYFDKPLSHDNFVSLLIKGEYPKN